MDALIGMLVSFAIGLFIVAVYKKAFTGVMYSTGFSLSLVGLSLITTLVIMAVTTNIVLSLGMVGALSIVRFRAAIKEPMEIVFLFWALAAGIVVGAGMIPLAVIGSLLIGAALFLLANRKAHSTPYILIVNCENEAAEESVAKLIEASADRFTVKSKTVNDAGIELTAEVRVKNNESGFVNRLNELPGVSDATLVVFNGEYLS